MRSEWKAEQSPDLFETKTKEGISRAWYFIYASTVFISILLVWIYRALNIPSNGEKGRWAWILLFLSELWFGLYWLVSQSLRSNVVYRSTFKEKLSLRYKENLPGVDIFVCTANPKIEPPIMVINTVLSVMAYDYPTEKLSVYLSDDAGSDLTFYALLEASNFAKIWIPFCKKFNVEPRSPSAYFKLKEGLVGSQEEFSVEQLEMKKLYKEMEDRINSVVKSGKISENISKKHKGFFEWNDEMTARNHPPIVQILIDGRDKLARDNEGCVLPTLVYMAREKKPNRHHNFKAGAMNSLLRVSSAISKGEFILNIDCDMYSNNSETIKNVLCFFLDEQKGRNIAYVQLPQHYDNITKNDIYGNSILSISEIDFHGLDGYGGPLYIGSGCYHRRISLLGNNFQETLKYQLIEEERDYKSSVPTLEAESKKLITCTYEDNSQWGNTEGLKYGCPVEDVITGLSIQCNGWKSVYFNPKRRGFLGVSPSTLEQILIQHKRWSEGNFQIFLSKYSPIVYGRNKISFGLQMGYTNYGLWAPNSIPMICYVVMPPLFFLHGVSLFPNVNDYWFLPFAYTITATCAFSLVESLNVGYTLKGWWNEQRIWLYKRLASYPFALFDTLLKQIGIAKSAFVISPKVADNEVLKRYEKEMIEFGSASLPFVIISTLALLSPICLIVGLVKLLIIQGTGFGILGSFIAQIIICFGVILVNLPVFEAMFVRNDGGSVPITVVIISLAVTMLAFVLPV